MSDKRLCISFSACALLLFFTGRAVSPGAEVPSLGRSSGYEASAIPSVFEFEGEDADYQETPLRRFEIIFFISLPASVLLSVAGVIAYRAASGRSVQFSSLEYSYIGLSSIGISLSIALHDHRETYKKHGF